MKAELLELADNETRLDDVDVSWQLETDSVLHDRVLAAQVKAWLTSQPNY